MIVKNGIILTVIIFFAKDLVPALTFLNSSIGRAQPEKPGAVVRFHFRPNTLAEW